MSDAHLGEGGWVVLGHIIKVQNRGHSEAAQLQGAGGRAESARAV